MINSYYNYLFFLKKKQRLLYIFGLCQMKKEPYIDTMCIFCYITTTQAYNHYRAAQHFLLEKDIYHMYM